MFRYIFFLIVLIGFQIPALLYGTPKWLCKDPKGCPIVNNTCPTCIAADVVVEEKPHIIKVYNKVYNKVSVIREVIREVPVPTIIQVAIPPSINFSNPRVHLASLSRTSKNEWSWSAKVSSFTCAGTRITSATQRGNFRCNGESTEYFITFF